MLNISGYIGLSSEIPVVDNTRPFVVSSCGHYRLIRQKELRTVRAQGRPDYQLLYIAGGKITLHTSDGEQTVPEGHAVLYRPGEPQDYRYCLGDRADVYWLHFSGREVPALLKRFALDERVLRAPARNEYVRLFESAIRELQLKRGRFEEMAALYLEELLTLLARHAAPGSADADGPVEEAIRLFHSRYREPISLEDFARARGMSPCWFARLFRRQTGVSPQQYLTEVRIGKARELLVTTSCSIGEVAAIAGYANPLYFSRLFHRVTGLTPSQYRKNGGITAQTP